MQKDLRLKTRLADVNRSWQPSPRNCRAGGSGVVSAKDFWSRCAYCRKRLPTPSARLCTMQPTALNSILQSPIFSAMQKASLAEKFALIQEHWRPKVVAQLNGQELKLAKCQG